MGYYRRYTGSRRRKKRHILLGMLLLLLVLALAAGGLWRSGPARPRNPREAAPAEASAPARRSTGKRPAKAVGRNKK